MQFRRPASSSHEAEPFERWIPLTAKLLLYAWLCYFFYQAVTTFDQYVPGEYWPFMLSMIRTWTFLPIHEAGHLFFRVFGSTGMILGGSLLQILAPLAWFVVALRQRSQSFPIALFFVGENILDVSLYMRDAPLRQLPLLGGHRSGHDWYNLFHRWDLLESAGTIADICFVAGIVISAAAILFGLTWSIARFVDADNIIPRQVDTTECVEELMDASLGTKRTDL